MNSPIVDIKDLIEAESSPIFTYATDLFLASQPEEPDTCVTLSDTGGFAPDVSFSSSEGIRKPTIQALSRADTYVLAYSNLELIFNYLQALHNQTINGTRYISIFATSDALPLGRDKRDRILLSQNYRIDRT